MTKRTKTYYGAKIYEGVLGDYVKEEEFKNITCPACNKKNTDEWGSAFSVDFRCNNVKCKGYLKPFAGGRISFNGHLMLP